MIREGRCSIFPLAYINTSKEKIRKNLMDSFVLVMMNRRSNDTNPDNRILSIRFPENIPTDLMENISGEIK
jgi:hypothetical protein